MQRMIHFVPALVLGTVVGVGSISAPNSLTVSTKGSSLAHASSESVADQQITVRGVIKEFRLHADGSVFFLVVPSNSKEEHTPRWFRMGSEFNGDTHAEIQLINMILQRTNRPGVPAETVTVEGRVDKPEEGRSVEQPIAMTWFVVG